MTGSGRRADAVDEGPEDDGPGQQPERDAHDQRGDRQHGGLRVHGAADPPPVRAERPQDRQVAPAAVDGHEQGVDEGDQRQHDEQAGQQDGDPPDAGDVHDRRRRGFVSRPAPHRTGPRCRRPPFSAPRA